ncbi:MAG: GntR family transcriptional regulator [Deltaproteobacteria bacterium]|nr:GntR family transcriptional regulator [Deltaproteobacteria bacterium]
MLPFAIQLKTGAAVYDQVLSAVKRALISGQLKPGDRFPSVRLLSQELRISPNVAHKIVSTLIEEGLLTVQPGVGTTVEATKPATAQQKQELIEPEIERLVVDARLISLELEDLLPAVEKIWRRSVREEN